MKFLSWFKKRERGQIYPESLGSVALTANAFEVTDTKGGKQVLPGIALVGIAIETNDSGPWFADVWWLLYGRDGSLACACPQGATGEQQLLDHFLALPDFDHEAMALARQSTSNAVFPVWSAQAYSSPLDPG